MKVISLGWGTQSFALAAMVALGELEPVDFAIHADTTHESYLTYQFAQRWTGWLESHGVKVITVRPADADFQHRQELNGVGTPPVYSLKVGDERGYVHIPAHQGDERGEHGQLLRSCTQRWKIAPMRRWIAAELDRQKLPKTPKIVEQWIGISLDEFTRMKDSDVKYVVNRWPLIERKMSRWDCQLWLQAHNLEIPPRSACTFCPFHNTAEWRRIKETPEDWAEAVAVDNAIRKARPPYELFVHPARLPLTQVDLRTTEEKGQMSLWDNECTGLCGI